MQECGSLEEKSFEEFCMAVPEGVRGVLVEKVCLFWAGVVFCIVCGLTRCLVRM